ncbi:MAG: stage V sporulation protein AD, partial [Methylocystaceae bacterium]
MSQRRQTMFFARPVCLQGWAAVVGPDEENGPWQGEFDYALPDHLWGEKSWEQTESKMIEEAVLRAVALAGCQLDAVDLMLAGDLLNQTTSSNYAAGRLKIPLAGLYGACSTMAEALALGGALISGEFFTRVVCATSSHHLTAERQYRFPTEQGVQRPLSAQWTVTGSGSVVLGQDAKSPLRLTCATLGQIVDSGQSDANDMGGAMAPAAAHTLLTHLQQTGRSPEFYDLIVTGDLGRFGLEIMRRLCKKEGLTLGDNCSDCGVLIYKPQ